MSREKKFFTEKDKKIIILGIIFSVVYVLALTQNFIFNCIIEWPIRWNIKSCWDEQKAPARQKAIEVTSNFL